MPVLIHPHSPVSPDLLLETFEMITLGTSPSPATSSSCIARDTICSVGTAKGNPLVPRHNAVVHYRGNEDMMESTLGAHDEHDQRVPSNECANCSYERMRFVTPLREPMEAVEVQQWQTEPNIIIIQVHHLTQSLPASKSHHEH